VTYAFASIEVPSMSPPVAVDTAIEAWCLDVELVLTVKDGRCFFSNLGADTEQRRPTLVAVFGNFDPCRSYKNVSVDGVT
jgi:hypothetical protein